MIVQLGILVFVTAQRLGELVISRSNTRRLIAKGGYEAAPGHYPLLVGLHAAWIVGLWLLALNRPVQWAWMAVFALCQLARAWTIFTLGERWTTRILILPGAPKVTAGPYRFLSHPNYAVVVVELAVLPLAFGLVIYAAIFSVLNALVLWIRIRAEDAAWAAVSSPPASPPD